MLLTMKKCRMYDPKYRQTDRFLETRSRIQLILNLYKQRFMSMLDTGHVTQNFFFRSFTQISVTSEERPELSTKWRISGKFFQGLVNAKNA